MNKHNNIEMLKVVTKNWFERGVGGRRDWEECQAYLEGLEVGVLDSWESAGVTSMAVYNANSVTSEIDDYIVEELMEMKDE